VKVNEHNFLVCRTDALGDTLLTLPVCTALKKAYPQARVSMLVAPYTQDVVKNHPDVDQVLVEDKHLAQKLKAEKFDTVLVVFPDPKISWALWRARIPRRVGTNRRWWSFLYNVRVKHSRAKAEKHEAEYNLDLVRALGVKAELHPPKLSVLPEEKKWAQTFYKQQQVSAEENLIIIHPGGRGSSANWDVEQYGQLADLVMKKFSCKVFLTGSKSEQERLRSVAKYCEKKPLCLEQSISLNQFSALLQRASVVVAGNTGPLHLASALDVPVVTVFPHSGVTGPKRWGPLNKRAVVLTPPVSKHSEDLKQVKPEQVLEKMSDWVQAS
jgi:ADP-heptose:LPS heptosyltransferase